MPAPVVQSVSGVQGLGTSLVCPAPTGIANDDLLMAFINLDEDGTITAPSGFTQLLRNTDATNTLEVWWKKAASESGDYTWQQSRNDRWQVAMARIDGQDLTTPFPDTPTQSNGSGTTQTAPSITTSKADSLILRCLGLDDDAGNLTANPGSDGHTLVREESTGGSASDGCVSVYRENQASAGASGSTTWSTSATETWKTATVAVAPAAAGGGALPMAMDHYRRKRI